MFTEYDILLAQSTREYLDDLELSKRETRDWFDVLSRVDSSLQLVKGPEDMDLSKVDCAGYAFANSLYACAVENEC